MTDPAGLAARYPTGSKLIDDLTEFAGARLPTIFGPPPQCRIPSLAEDWWVKDRLAEGYRFPVKGMDQESALRCCYRWARNRNVETGRVVFTRTDDAASLLLHQMTELIPAMFRAAQSIQDGEQG